MIDSSSTIWINIISCFVLLFLSRTVLKYSSNLIRLAYLSDLSIYLSIDLSLHISCLVSFWYASFISSLFRWWSSSFITRNIKILCQNISIYRVFDWQLFGYGCVNWSLFHRFLFFFLPRCVEVNSQSIYSLLKDVRVLCILDFSYERISKEIVSMFVQWRPKTIVTLWRVWEKNENFLQIGVVLFWKSSSVVEAKDTQHAHTSSKYWLKATIFFTLRSCSSCLSLQKRQENKRLWVLRLSLFLLLLALPSSTPPRFWCRYLWIEIVSFTIATHFASRCGW